MPSIQVPDYFGGSLVNLIAELEHRLIGSAASPRLHSRLAELIPEAATYVLFFIDGLGAHQLSHPDAAPLAASQVATLDAPFPTTTTVSWATIATGLPPSRHGLIGYQLYIPEVQGVVYTIKWKRPWGEDVELDLANFLPAPNLWERLKAAGAEPITIQPGNFSGTNMSQVLFRGCRFEAVYTADEMVDATAQLATTPQRLIVTYVPHVDVAAHMTGQRSPDYADAVDFVAALWSRLEQQMPAGAVLLATADHGHVDYPSTAAVSIDRAHESGHVFYGDSRVMFVRGDGAKLARDLPARWIPLDDMADWWGPGPPHPSFTARAPHGILVADDDKVIHHKYSDDRMIGHHGGLTDPERVIPLLVGRS